MRGPGFSLSTLLLFLFLGSNVKPLSTQETVPEKIFMHVSPTPSSRGLTASQSGEVLTSLSESATELSSSTSSGEITGSDQSTLASTVDGTTFGDLGSTNWATPATFTAVPLIRHKPDMGTTATGSISLSTSAAEATMRMTFETPTNIPTLYAVVPTQSSTAMLTDAGASTKLYETTRELAVSDLTTSLQQENTGQGTDALSSSTESMHSSSKPPSPALTIPVMTPSPTMPAVTNPVSTPSPSAPALTTAPTNALTTAAVTLSEAVSTPLALTEKTPSMGLPTGSKTTQEQIMSQQATTNVSEPTIIVNATIPDLNMISDRKVIDAVPPSQSPSWVLIAVIAGCVLLGATVCLAMLIKCRVKSRRQSGHINGWGQRPKTKKGAGEDTWAGPVMLEGREKVEFEGPEEGPGHGVDKNAEETDGMLSTFVALAENGVGRDGSKEAQKWEEQEPLLYIDEDVKQEGREKEGVGKEKEEEPNVKGGSLGNTETRETELNGETYCLTTAV